MALYSQTYETPWSYEEEAVRAVPPLAAQGVIESYTFPSSADVNVQSSWSIIVHNIGTDGRFAAGIVNSAGNPGNMTIIWQGVETVILPGDYFRIYSVNPEPYCVRLNETGGVKFAVAGSYNIKLWAMHEGAPDEWFYDDERVLTVNVAGVTPPEWPITIPIHVFDNVKLKAEWWEIAKEDSNTIINIDTALLLGGKLEYRVQYTQGLPIAEIANIDFDGTNIVSERLSKGEIKSGTIDLTGLIGRDATITIRFDSSPGIWSEILFDVWLTLGFSEEPPIPPGPPPFDWWEWLRDNAWWISLAVLGTGLIIMYRPSPPVVIYQPPGKRDE